MRNTQTLLVLIATAMLIPMASAQTGGDPEFTSDPQNIGSSSEQTVAFGATLACSAFLDPAFLEGAPATTLTKTATVTYPAGLSGPGTTDVTFDGAPCTEDPTAEVTADGSIAVTVLDAAAGKVDLPINLASGDATHDITVQVDYRPGYFYDEAQSFPIEVNRDEETGEWIPVEWTATLVVTANADTMVMMQVTEKATYGSVSGLFANSPQNFFLTEDEIANGAQRTVSFSYTPTSDAWTEDTLSFTTWSHWMDDGTMKTDDEMVTWTFINGDAEDSGITCETDEEGMEVCEESGIPSAGAGLSALAILGAALVAARRRE